MNEERDEYLIEVLKGNCNSLFLNKDRQIETTIISFEEWQAKKDARKRLREIVAKNIADNEQRRKKK